MELKIDLQNTDRLMQYVQSTGFWDEMLIPTARALGGVDENKLRQVIGALTAQVMVKLASGAIEIEDDEAFAELGVLLGLVGVAVGREIGLDVPDAPRGIQVVARLPGERRLRYLPVLGWKDLDYGRVYPNTYVDLSHAAWGIIDWDAQHGVRANGSVTDIATLEAELLGGHAHG